MENPNQDPILLTEEQLAALSDAQKQIFTKLEEADQRFFARNFSAESLGRALERKWGTYQSQARLRSFDERVKENMLNKGSPSSTPSTLTGADLAVGAAGVAGMVGIGVLASQIAPEGKAAWRGVTPRDLVDPLERDFRPPDQNRSEIHPAKRSRCDPGNGPDSDHGRISARAAN